MKAYMTLLSTNSYLDGVLGLNESLKMVGARYPLVVAITPNISLNVRKILQQCKIETIEIMPFNYTDAAANVFKSRGMPHWISTGSKLRFFGMTEYERIIMLDADMMIIKNIDHLFNYPAWSAAPDSPMLSLENSSAHMSLNSGLLVIEPQQGLDTDLMKIALQYNFQDQDTIRYHCSDWASNSSLHLPQGYNIFAGEIEKYEKAKIFTEDYYVIHFIGKIKPFQEVSYISIGEKGDYFKKLYLRLIAKATENFI